MRVLHLTLSLARGGRRTAIFSLIDGLRGLGIDNNLCCMDELGCAPQEVSSIGIPIDVLGRRSLFDRAAVGRLRTLLLKLKPDILHNHDAGSQATAALARLGSKRVPMVMTFHRSRSNETATFGNRVRNALACTQCGAIITGSRERRQHFLSRNFVPARKVILIPFGTDLSRFYPDPESRRTVREEFSIPPDEVLIGVIGHFGPEKGVDIAIRAFQALARHPLAVPVSLIIFGEGDRRSVLQALAAEANAPGKIRFAGFRQDIERYMRGLDVLLHTPRLEAFGLVLIEAMATALPVVGSDVGGIPDLIRHGKTGFLAKPEDPEALADALKLLVEQREQRASMSQEARRVALAEYDRELYARRYLRVYTDLSAHRAPLNSWNDSQITS